MFGLNVVFYTFQNSCKSRRRKSFVAHRYKSSMTKNGTFGQGALAKEELFLSGFRLYIRKHGGWKVTRTTVGVRVVVEGEDGGQSRVSEFAIELAL